jgi:predicted transcriptional regulator
MNQKLKSLFTLLKTFKHPAAISELSAKLNLSENVSNRTIRRRLQQLIELGLVESQGKNKGLRYSPVSLEENLQVSNLDSNYSGFIFTAENQTIIDQIRQPLIKRDPCSYNADWLEAYQPDQTYYLSLEQRQLLHQQGKPLMDELPAGTYARKIFNHLLINLSYNSARLEGNTYSLIDTEKLLLEGKTASSKLKRWEISGLTFRRPSAIISNTASKLRCSVQRTKPIG